MKMTEAIGYMMRASGVSQAKVALGAGKSRQFINDFLRRDDVMVSNACKIANATGCEIVLRVKGEKDGIVITYD